MVGNVPNLILAQKQDVAMTTELRQAIELLQLNGAELLDMVAREVGDNPCLEFEEGEASRSTDANEGREDGEWNSGESWEIRDEGYAGVSGTGRGGGVDADGEGWEARATREMDLQEYLYKQYQEIVQEPKLRLAGKFLIDAIDEAGYLRVDIAAVALQLKVHVEVVDDARAIIQTLEPAGIGAKDLGECLMLQMHARGQLCPVSEICLTRLDLVAAKDWPALAKLANCDDDEVPLCVEEIRKCNPKPAQGFGTMKIQAVVPDVIISPEEIAGVAGWKVELNGAAFPKLMAVPLNFGGGSGKAAAVGKAYAQERFGRARWLLGALEQRAKTTLAVGKAIVVAQRQFLDAGKEFMIPLTLREIADKVGVHESTVSRVVSGKYMHTPWGVVAFRTFFASGVASTGGNVGVAASSVQALISRLVRAEDAKKPLSDEQIVKKLADEGVAVARRTVAKYRGILQIPGTAERRVRIS